MYVTLRDRPGAEDADGAAGSEASAGAAQAGGSEGSAGTDGGPAGSPRRRRFTAGVGRTVVTLGLVSLVTDVSSEAVNSVFPYFVTTVLGLSVLSYGFLDGLYQGVTALVRLLGGWLADRGDHPKWVAAAGYLLSSLSRLGLVFAGGFGALTAATTADRLGKGLRTAPRDVMIAAASEPASLGRAFGVHRTLDTAGALLGPLAAFAVLLAVPHDVHAVFVMSFAVSLIGVAMLVLLVPDRRPRRDRELAEAAIASEDSGPDRTPTDPAPAVPVAAVPAPLDAAPVDTAPVDTAPVDTAARSARSRVRAVYLVAALLGLCSIGDGFLYLAATRDQSAVASWFPLLFVGTNLAYMVLAVPFGRLADRIGRRTVFLAGHGALLGAYLFAGGVLGGVPGLVGLVLLLGAYYAATDGVLPAVVSVLAPPARRARVIASAQTAVAVARFGSSLLFGLVWVRASADTAVAVFGVALVAAVAVSAVLLRRSVAPRRPSSPSAPHDTARVPA